MQAPPPSALACGQCMSGSIAVNRVCSWRHVTVLLLARFQLPYGIELMNATQF
jgi:hypothetical protein